MTESNQQGEMPEDIIQRIGHLTRMLRNGMKELGLDKEIEKAADAIPDARDRLHYVGTMTEQAAERALNAIDIANPIQDSLSAGAESIQGKWDSWLADPDALSDTDIHALMKETRDYLASVPESTASTQKQLLEIMMAQDFQDLTGQVIKKMMDVITGIEEQLVQVLIDNASPEQRDALKSKHKIDEDNTPSLLNGPQIKDDAEGAVSSQDQVDDLLSDLGF